MPNKKETHAPTAAIINLFPAGPGGSSPPCRLSDAALIPAQELPETIYMEICPGDPFMLNWNYCTAAHSIRPSCNMTNHLPDNYAGAGVGTGALTEAGLFGAVTANTVPMWFSATFAVMNKGANDTITVNWTITLT